MDVFRYESWQMLEYRYFEECTLLRKIGDFDEGHKFEYIVLNDLKMELQFFSNVEDSVPVMVKSFRFCE